MKTNMKSYVAGVAVAFALFASGFSIWTAYAGRILLGLAASCAFITTLKIATHWCSPQQYNSRPRFLNRHTFWMLPVAC